MKRALIFTIGALLSASAALAQGDRRPHPSIDGRRGRAPGRRAQSRSRQRSLRHGDRSGSPVAERKCLRAGVFDSCRHLDQRGAAIQLSAWRAWHRYQRSVHLNGSAAAPPVGLGQLEPVVGHVSPDVEQSADELRSRSAVGLPARDLSAVVERSQDGSRAPADNRREAQSRKLRAAGTRVGRPDDGGREAGVLDAQGDARERDSAAALARACAGAHAAEQGRGSMSARRRLSTCCRPRPRWRSGAKT